MSTVKTTTCSMCGESRPVNAYCTCLYGTALDASAAQERRAERAEDERDRLAETLRLRSEALGRVVAENDRLRARLFAVRALHRPVDVPGIPGTSLAPFTRCSCRRGLLVAECQTAAALAGEKDAP